MAVMFNKVLGLLGIWHHDSKWGWAGFILSVETCKYSLQFELISIKLGLSGIFHLFYTRIEFCGLC